LAAWLGSSTTHPIAADCPTITKAWVDSGYKVKAVEHGAALGIDVDVVPSPGQGRGFQVIPRRWPVERTFGWIMMRRRFARDYETKPEHSESMIRSAAIDNLARRATGESTITCYNL
jgi:transposase